MAKVKNPRVPRTRVGNTLTEAAYFGLIRSTLRKGLTYYPSKTMAYAAIPKRVSHYIDKKTKRGSLVLYKKDSPRGKKGTPIQVPVYERLCARCTDWHDVIQMDHIIPCGSLRTFDDIGGWCKRAFCEPEDYQGLCKPCHKIKTAEDRIVISERKKK